jgi:integrase
MPNKKKDCSFFLKDTKADTPTLINFHMTIPGEPKPLKRSIGRYIKPTDWDFDTQLPHPTKDRALKEITQVIESIIDVIPVVRADCRRNNRVISKADMNAALDVILQKKQAGKAEEAEEAPATDMLTDFEAIIEGMKDGSVLTPGRQKKRYKLTTIRNYEERCLPKLKLFYKEKKLQPSYELLNLQVYYLFISWCHTMNLSDNSIGTYIKCWRRMGQVAREQGKHSNLIFENEEFAILKEDTEDIYFDEAKIKAMSDVKLIGYYEIARDWFVLDCYLGLRISDLRRVEIEDFAGEYFQFVNQKTGAHIAIKINRFVRAIIKKWKGLPPSISEKKFNEYIKEVAKSAKLNKKFIYKITKGGVLITETLEEWQMVSSHTCRRSLITNLLNLGFAHAHVMKIVGIKRYETLMRYFKQSAQEVAEETGKEDFFK